MSRLHHAEVAREVVAQELARDRVAAERVGEHAREERAVVAHEARQNAQRRAQRLDARRRRLVRDLEA